MKRGKCQAAEWALLVLEDVFKGPIRWTVDVIIPDIGTLLVKQVIHPDFLANITELIMIQTRNFYEVNGIVVIHDLVIR